MCGIFGIVAKKKANIEEKKLYCLFSDLSLISEARGKDSSGLVTKHYSTKSYNVVKGPVPVAKLLKSEKASGILDLSLKEYFNIETTSSFVSFGHSRLVTNGSQINEHNNQPVIKEGLIGVHNGIIVNVDEIWSQHKDIRREYDIDTEVMFALIRKYLSEGKSTIDSYNLTLNEIFGTVATAIAFNDMEEFLLGTNNGSLYILSDYVNILIFASEKYFLLNLLKKHALSSHFPKIVLRQIEPNTGILIDTINMKFYDFGNSNGQNINYSFLVLEEHYSIDLNAITNSADTKSVVIDVDKFASDPTNHHKINLLEYNLDRIKKLKRCIRCVLPETFPFIEFNQDGVCNYCLNYVQRNQPKSIDELKELVKPYRSKSGEHDCLIPFSGGRDSTYVLHFVKNVLHLNPLAFTYDWGMVTDLARRNIARVCGKLGIENIIVAADIRKKRENIKKNINAWLKRPQLGMIPLFMAGDKYFFKYANQVRKQNNIKLQIWGINFLENTDFKVGFCGVEPQWNKKMIYSMNLKRQAKLFKFVSQNLLMNPSYFNESVFDTFGSFISRYLNPREDYYHFFDFHQWNEKEIETILINEYEWEIANDLNSTWRIGDGTASFYNYIYYTVAGFSEFDTFRSNQIREGMISREEALKLVTEENRPRYESLRWYLEIIGLDFETVIKRINQIPKLY
jgi:asparagine synthetase B (glutamine-hydrolysing)